MKYNCVASRQKKPQMLKLYHWKLLYEGLLSINQHILLIKPNIFNRNYITQILPFFSSNYNLPGLKGFKR